MLQEFIIVYVTAGSPEEGEKLARTLVEERLAACVNRIKPVQSVYRWQGQVEQSDEELPDREEPQKIYSLRWKKECGSSIATPCRKSSLCRLVAGSAGYHPAGWVTRVGEWSAGQGR